ncbi:response regulator transcription factor [Polaribacter uvawellassae]|uniref:response regulator transcription factor n=1 Tax=Polaribacter uvawellassae TaxID=3133495 RepID=UPI00321ACE63
MNKRKLNVVIADDNRFFCEALKGSLNTHSELNIVATFCTIKEVINFTKNHPLDVLILDVNFNGNSSLDFISEIRNTNKPFKIIALTTMNNNYIKDKALENGVDVFIGKDTDFTSFKDVILECAITNTNGNTSKSSKVTIDNLVFTKRKLEILEALYQHSDKKEKELAVILNITESALKSHKRDLFEITNTKNTPELIKFGIQKGLIVA